MTQDGNRTGDGTFERPRAADDAKDRPLLLAGSAVLFAAIALLIGVDLASDWSSGTGRGHLAAEVTVMALALMGLAALWSQLHATRRRAHELQRDLGLVQADVTRWREEAEDLLRGLGTAIDRQFARWELSAAEREVGLLLLKGLSHKEIATVRATSERTARQQSLAVYRKARLAGRAELAAFFLEDLLLPAASGNAVGTSPAPRTSPP